MERMGAKIDHLIDINPSKQGMFVPGTGIKIESPGAVLPLLDGFFNLFVMNSNYVDEIVASLGRAASGCRLWKVDDHEQSS